MDASEFSDPLQRQASIGFNFCFTFHQPFLWKGYVKTTGASAPTLTIWERPRTFEMKNSAGNREMFTRWQAQSKRCEKAVRE
jgi:hypothetical protein